MKIEILYSKKFLKMISKIDTRLQEEVLEKIELFRETENHKQLKVHKLQGYLKDNFSFSVNYRYRILFEYMDKKTAILLVFDDHDMYK